MTTGSVKLLSETDIRSSMSDSRFYELLPEFAPLKGRLQAADSALVKKGCSKCARRRAYNSVAIDYMLVLSTLGEDGKRRVKEYFGATGIRAIMLDPSTRMPKTVRI